MVTVYTRHQCSACEGVKGYLKDNAIPFQEVNIMEDYNAAVKLVEAGIRSVPVLENETGERFIGAAAIHAALS